MKKLPMKMNDNWKKFILITIISFLALITIINLDAWNNKLWVSLLIMELFFMMYELTLFFKKKNKAFLFRFILYLGIFGITIFYFYYSKLLIIY
ncbi:hypothetical protein [Tenacibaculum amylolyticum]|uniref:hypothetical protein n=1 Tax=Tenacibaculum amylolyticum TaxID=104269 RepID=UPI0038938660